MTTLLQSCEVQMPMYNFECVDCKHIMEDLVPSDTDAIVCEKCSGDAIRIWAGTAPNLVNTIILDYPGSKKHKAGYVHSHGDRPATKIQSGYGGSQGPQ